jgi:hypothetical protein
MTLRLRVLVLGSLVLGLSACGAKVTVDGTNGSDSSTGGGSGVGGAGGAGGASTGTGVIVPCAEGQCVVPPGTTCEAPSGPTGNGCCACSTDGVCSSLCK